MESFVPPFDLDFLQDERYLRRLIEKQFNAPVTAVSQVGQGFYARVYRVSTAKEPREIIVKCHLYAGRGREEQRQLEMLARHAIVKVPRVYFLHLYSADFPCEALAMEYIPGINAADVQFPDEASKNRFVDLVVENLLAWHSVSNPSGFGELDGVLCPTWTECFGRRIALYHEHIHKDEHQAIVSGHVTAIIDRSFAEMGRIFERANETPSLVHSDYNAWNMLVDPKTFALTGVIDPLDAGWSDSEIDLFHLPNSRPDLKLLERYMREIQVDEAFWMRYKFYRFWDDVKHYLRMGWYNEDRFRNYGQELQAAMDECL